jgi:hypothetical protein
LGVSCPVRSGSGASLDRFGRASPPRDCGFRGGATRSAVLGGVDFLVIRGFLEVLGDLGGGFPRRRLPSVSR